MQRKFYLLIVLVTTFLVSTEMLLTLNSDYFTRNIIVLGTIIVSAIVTLSFTVTATSVSHKNPNKFVRGVMLSMIIKFFLFIISVSIMLFMLKNKLNKPDLFLLMFVYVIYTVMEAAFMSKMQQKKQP